MRTLAEIATFLDASLVGPGERRARGVAPLHTATAEDVVFVKDDRHAGQLADVACAAVICRSGVAVGSHAALHVDNPRLAAARLVAWLQPEPVPPAHLSPHAHLDESAEVPDSCHIAPGVVVGADTVLGEHVVLDAGVVIGAGCRVGEGSRLHPRVVLYPGVRVGRQCEIHAGAVLGGPGFGVEPGPEGPVPFPQRGTVHLGDRVRVGANTTIDRATFDVTRIGSGTQIDNLVQVAHNVTIADGTIVCAQAGLAGGATTGPGAILGPQAALSPDSHLGGRTILGARAALASHQRIDDPGQVYMDGPPMKLGLWKRFQIWKTRGHWRRTP